MTDTLDLLIIGAGPIGLSCGIEAKKAGLSFVIVEKGCLVNSLYHYPANMTFFSTSEKLEIGGIPFVSIQAKPSRAEALEYYRRVTLTFDLQPQLFESVTGVRPIEDHFEVSTSKAVYRARNVVISTGFYDVPNLMNIPGEQLPKVSHYYQDPHFFAMQRVLVVGANNSSVDAALETYRKGAAVTMVIRGSEIGRRVKYWVKPDIENRIAEGSITAYFNSELLSVSEHEAVIRTPGGTVTIGNDFVLALTGYQPDFDLLRRFGLHLSADERLRPEHDIETMETNVNGIYLAGVVCGGLDTHSWFIENSRDHAGKIVRSIVSKRKTES